ncbi:MAG TPA: DEAD/DEAH box helicase [Candidatus Limnocylindrales bacterium]|nr:DEAD/DEAH box helicase [Candidatus Limnocylindrales bacterium]
MSFESLGLLPELLRAVEAEGYKEPTPVQEQSIPHILAGRDLLAGAQTGTGKTAAFVLPILQRLHSNRPTPRHPIRESGSGRGRSRLGARPQISSGLPIRALVLTPTRELAIQVEEFVQAYSRSRPVRSATIYGGVGYESQFLALHAGPEIVVATPGRLLDIQEQNKIDLRSVEILVLDEADRMLDMGFIRDIRKIIGLLPAKRQNLMFSATFSDEIRELAATLLTDPAQVQVARRNAPIDLVRQVVMPVDRHRKRELLSFLIRSGRIDRALVFARTKHGTQRLAEQLERDGIRATAIHGDRSQGQRIKALDDFKEGRVDILVATEVAARGLDIDGLPHVVNFELPTVPEDYVHRIGRTGRAGMQGDAVSLVCIDELDLLNDIEGLLRQRIKDEIIPGFEIDRTIRAEPIKEIRRGASGGGAGRSGGPRSSGPRSSAPRRHDAGAPRSAASRAGGRPSTPRTSSSRPTASRPVAGAGGSHSVMPGERLARNPGA